MHQWLGGAPGSQICGRLRRIAVELSPFAIERVSFDVARRGYDRSQVDGFVAEMAAGVETLTTRLREAETRAAALQRRLTMAEERADHAEEVLVVGIAERLEGGGEHSVTVTAAQDAAEAPEASAGDIVTADNALRMARQLLADARRDRGSESG
ncbi:MAG: DivIVA domain-containing protein [Acidimicrobiia bacterium]